MNLNHQLRWEKTFNIPLVWAC